ncbi:MAG: HAD-IA family hydrolase [Verrucomicrobiales bacterium]
MRPQIMVFDIGMVLLPFDYQKSYHIIQPQCKKALLSPEVEQLKVQHETGALRGDKFFTALAETVDYQGSFEDLRQAWCDIFEVNTPMVEYASALKTRLDGHIYLLSNIGDVHAAYLEGEHPFLGMFRDRVYSFEVGCMKPSPEIFRLTEEKFALPGGQIAYVDDMLPNVEAARQAGWTVAHYDCTNHQDFLKAQELWFA